MITTHRYDLSLRVLIEDVDGMRRASLLECDIAPAWSTDSDEKICATIGAFVESWIREGKIVFMLPCYSAGLEQAWTNAQQAEAHAGAFSEPYAGDRARTIRLRFDVPKTQPVTKP